MVTDLGPVELTDKELLKQLKKRLTKEIGRKCKDYHPMCFICMCWHAYLVLEEASKLWEKPKGGE
jgi:hypothetical protein